MRADIHNGPEHMLQSEAGYIDARPLTPARQNLLQRTAGPYIRVTSGRTRVEHIKSAPPQAADVTTVVAYSARGPGRFHTAWAHRRHRRLALIRRGSPTEGR